MREISELIPTEKNSLTHSCLEISLINVIVMHFLKITLKSRPKLKNIYSNDSC